MWRQKEKQTIQVSVPPAAPIEEVPATLNSPVTAAQSSATVMPKPLRSIEEIMTELREVMIQYASCTDPSESAVRRRRLTQCEDSGLLKANAERIMELEANRNATAAIAVDQPDPSHGRDILNEASHSNTEAVPPLIRKKRGRPPVATRLQFPNEDINSVTVPHAIKPRKVARSPRTLPPRQRSMPKRLIHEGTGTSAAKSRKQKRNQVREETTDTSNVAQNPAGNQPPINLIPPTVGNNQTTSNASARRTKLDFQGQGSSLP